MDKIKKDGEQPAKEVDNSESGSDTTIQGKRRHQPLRIEKEIDKADPIMMMSKETGDDVDEHEDQTEKQDKETT